MRISQDVRDRFGANLDPDAGMKEKSEEFLEFGGTVYVKEHAQSVHTDF